MQPEAWLRGPLPAIDAFLMPAAHALVQASEDLDRAAAGLTTQQLWHRPGGAASIGFHLRHIAGSIARLLTYVRGEQLSEEQRKAIAQEGEAGDPPQTASPLVRASQRAIEEALEVIRSTPREELLAAREVGRARLPSTVLGLLFHIAEHTQRHTGQVITTAKIIAAQGRSQHTRA
jgi:uncharacterized damage-inducible protein DinB